MSQGEPFTVDQPFAEVCLPKHDVNTFLVPNNVGYVAWDLVDAMQVYWNLEAMVVNGKSFETFIPDNSFQDKPHQRVCGSSFTGMVRLYNGTTTDEANFLGYAWGDPTNASTDWISATDNGAPDFEQVVLSSYEVGIWATDTVETHGGIDFYVSAGSEPTDSIDSLTFYTY
tara:strand:- start:855 stop:1367 length:513 start_codon:yes stop_codon:yes gene_type:complete